MSICAQCGATIRQQARFCAVCGASMVALSPQLPAVVPPSGATLLMSSAASGMGLQLRISDGQIIPAYSPMVIGRDAGHSDVQVSDGLMSRAHVRLEEQNGQWLLTDLNSSNGTYVNGIAITAPAVIRPGDQIQMGNTVLSLQTPGQIVPSSLTPAWPGAGQIAVPVNSPMAVPPPPGGWQAWPQATVAEGVIQNVDKHTVKRDDLMQRGCLAVFLGLIFVPLAFLPFAQGSDVNALNIRILDAHTGKMVDVKVVGDLLGHMNLGDTVAVWGRMQKGMLVMQRAYNYTTGHKIEVRK
jgi:hypothetical protein